jgi:hypothetical protein
MEATVIERLARLVNDDPAIASMTVMKGLGHFPMSENPHAFLGYLKPVLEKIRTAAG